MAYVYGTGTNANYNGRILSYPNLVPFDTDFLRSDQYRMVDIANLAQTILGLPSTIGGSFSGFASGICTQDASPDMAVTIGVCSIYAQAQMEPIAYGNLGPLTTPVIFKQFINMLPQSSGTIAAPSTGNWMYYLIQGTPQTVQINNVNRPYYNASNPASPNFVSAPDTEIDNISFLLIAGTPSSKSGALPAIPATTGTGIGMFLILVSDNTETITNNLISGYPGSFIGTTLPQLPSAIQNSKFTYAVDSGTANAYVINPNPAITAYAAGQSFEMSVGHANTGASTVNISGLGTIPIQLANGAVLPAGALVAGMIANLALNASANAAQLLNAAQSSTSNIATFTSTGTLVVPAGVTTMYISGCSGGSGGGGSGGCGSSTAAGISAAGGDAGNTVIKSPKTVTPGETLTIVIGAGGTAGAAGLATPTAGGNGGVGGTTSVTGSITGAIVSLTGNPGGVGSNVANSGTATDGAQSVGNTGQSAGQSYNATVAGFIVTGSAGSGGSCAYGGGGAGAFGGNGSGAGNPGLPGQAFGAGGGGASGGQATSNNGPFAGALGGVGAPGLIILEW